MTGIRRFFSGFIGSMKQPSDDRESADSGIYDLQRQNCDLEKRLDEHNISLRSIQSELEESKREFENTSTALREAKRAKLVAEEQGRRWTQLLDECHQELETLKQENYGLTLNISQLQQQTDCLGDDEVKGILGQLYHKLDLWAQRHSLLSLPKNMSPNQQNGDLLPFSIEALDNLCKTKATVSDVLFRDFLSRDWATIDDPELTNTFNSLEQRIGTQCPTHMMHHWRSATSMGLYKLGESQLESLCNNIVANVETKLLGQSSTDAQAIRRSGELKKLVWEFFSFKQRLECQIEPYHFLWFGPGASFDNEWMSSYSGTYDSDSVLEYSIFPALYRGTKSNAWAVVEKAKVRILSSCERSIAQHTEKPAQNATQQSTGLPIDQPTEHDTERDLEDTIAEPTQQGIHQPAAPIAQPKEPSQEKDEEISKEETENTSEETSTSVSEPPKNPSGECTKEPLEESSKPGHEELPSDITEEESTGDEMDVDTISGVPVHPRSARD